VIALDTNVLVRLLVQDDPDQFAKALAVLERATETEEPCFVSDAVLCETAWVLASRYGAGRTEILAAMSELAADGRYAFDHPEALTEALQAFEDGRADFSHYLIGASARRRGARTMYTFDRKLVNHEGFTFLR
jgi:predicted nucleic-acid-binding protein